MQRGNNSRDDLFDMGDQYGAFPGFGGFGLHRTMMPNLFGGRDPFDDPFFTRPFGSIFDGIGATSLDAPRKNGVNGIVIQELDSDAEQGKAEKGTADRSMSSNEPSVEHPDNSPNERKMNLRNDYDRVEGTKSEARTFSVQTCKVTYGGIDSAYYTSTRTRRTGSDGVLIEESKEADTTTGQATHRISRGINDKGHSVTRKLNADGKVDAMQMLHNLNEDELASFEEAWNGNVKGYLPGWDDGFGMHENAGRADSEAGTNSHGDGTKKLLTIVVACLLELPPLASSSRAPGPPYLTHGAKKRKEVDEDEEGIGAGFESAGFDFEPSRHWVPFRTQQLLDPWIC
ncbi:hypothetical protein SLEP1_g24004 [Rubroshorea leprosula]|uniref:Myeloid leukemia factor n=1 Tax=Rubroshorea leprosula TaxID=152421 RepID=A0AAV5JNR5_9ROSI|nr:hypothetical protein SLEP1_g24004 [Rubroshorea leprosula]